MKPSKGISYLRERMFGRTAPSSCPHEADILAYFENRLTGGKRAEMERHFSGCLDCREALVLYVQIPGVTSGGMTPEPISEDAVIQQAGRVRAMIAEDEFNRGKERGKRRGCSRSVGRLPGRARGR